MFWFEYEILANSVFFTLLAMRNTVYNLALWRYQDCMNREGMSIDNPSYSSLVRGSRLLS